MGAFWSVAQGSAEPPALIVLRYEPEGVDNGPVLHPTDKDPSVGAPVLGLVGKGITFDTGGISIKPADNMEKMKYDMAGGAAMLGAMRAIALLKPKVRVIAIVCAAENMPSGTAQKPGDVQTAMPIAPDKPGKTIEIINTDAEGRLVLADGLTYARQLGATHLIDAATLTGAISVALGKTTAGVILQRRAYLREVRSRPPGLRRKVLAPAAGRGIRRSDQIRHRRHQEHRRPLRRRHHRCRVPAHLRRRHALDSSRHRRRSLGRRSQALTSPRAPAASPCGRFSSGSEAGKSVAALSLRREPPIDRYRKAAHSRTPLFHIGIPSLRHDAMKLRRSWPMDSESALRSSSPSVRRRLH